MDNYIYTVEIPAILNLLLNYETREFKDSNPGIAREKALIYLSDVIKKAIETLQEDIHNTILKKFQSTLFNILTMII